MRTTVEIRDELRARLLAMAARRGEKGFSHLVEEAIERFVVATERHEHAQRLALATRGMLDRAEAEELVAGVALVREVWR